LAAAYARGMAATFSTVPADLKVNRHDYAALPEGGPRHQLVNGRLIMAPSPSDFHQDIAGTIYRIIASHLDEHPIGYARIAPLDVYLGEHDVYQPDVIFVSKARRSILQDHGIEGGPDLVVEVLSPTTRQLDEGTKRKVYAVSGVRELWLVDPESGQVRVFELKKNSSRPARTCSSPDSFTSALLPGLEISCQRIFRRNR
jgi:Uma2 family endonuclease